MNCQNCKHWVFNKCAITGNYITADKLCNGWELSVSFDQAQKSNSTPENATELLKDNIAELKDFIDQLIKLGDAVTSALCVYDAEKDTREVCDWDLFTYAWKTSASKKQPATEREHMEADYGIR